MVAGIVWLVTVCWFGIIWYMMMLHDMVFVDLWRALSLVWYSLEQSKITKLQRGSVFKYQQADGSSTA